MKDILYFGTWLCLLVSCAPKKEDLLAKQWKAVSMENPNLAAAIAQERAAIDTFGQSEPDLAEVINIDSFKNMRRILLEHDIAEQKKALEQLCYTFRKDGVALLSTPDHTDSFKWKLEENQLLMKEYNAAATDNELYFTIVSLTTNQLCLSSIVEGDTVEMTLKAFD